MPKIVDHEARREEISAALWRIVEREGISGASIRSVANEAGYPKATAMHYFKNEAELLTCAMDQFIARSQSKISTLLEGTLTTGYGYRMVQRIHTLPLTPTDHYR